MDQPWLKGWVESVMIFLDTILAWAGFGFACMAILVGPWFFGSWEMWWFWPFTVCIFISTFFFAVRLLIRHGGTTSDTLADNPQSTKSGQVRNSTLPMGSRNRQSAFGIRHSSFIIVLSFLPFLTYAFVRFMQADVFMDAERSFLLFLTPFLLGIQIVFGFDRKKSELLFTLIIADLCLLGVYGIINHFITDSKLVLWAEGYPQYIDDSRATGAYFCPDHFSGIMELTFCLGLGLIMMRETERRWRILGALASLIALFGVVLSKSRGGGLTIIVIAGAALIWGFLQWPLSVRWYWRISAGALLAMALIIFSGLESPYMNRFKSYFRWDDIREESFEKAKTVVLQKVLTSSRGRMIGGAIRAWKTAPIFGIGPGMHQNLWPHFAASPDGDRELGIWPTLLNNDFHSYEVHSDWMQLLEEYGLVGLILFMIPASAVFGILLTELRREERERMQNNWRETGKKHNAVVLSGLFAYVSMAFHSIGDFNLQMPATVWLFAAILAMPLVHMDGQWLMENGQWGRSDHQPLTINH